MDSESCDFCNCVCMGDRRCIQCSGRCECGKIEEQEFSDMAAEQAYELKENK